MESIILSFINFFKEIYLNFIKSLPNILLAILFFSVFVFASRKMKDFFILKICSRLEDKLLSYFLAKVLFVILLLLGFVVTLKILGISSLISGIMATLGITTFIIGFAFKDIGENFISGIIMAIRHPFNLGDLIECNGLKGNVTGLNIRYTLIKTADGNDIYT